MIRNRLHVLPSNTDPIQGLGRSELVDPDVRQSALHPPSKRRVARARRAIALEICAWVALASTSSTAIGAPAAVQRASLAGAIPRPSPTATTARSMRPTNLEIDHVYFDAPGDGAIWALGRTYKASFARTGASYIPNFGPNAPTDYPVTLKLDRATVGDRPIELAREADPKLDGARITYDRGGLVESYDVSLEGLEQEFVLARLPGQGDLVLEISVGTELARTEAQDGFRFSGELGEVRYGRATLIDGAGVRTPISTHLEAGTIRMRVPWAVLERSVLPIVIDPVLVTFQVSTTLTTNSYEDIAYDATNNVYEIVWEQAFSATDHDCYSILQDSTGATVPGSLVAIDFTSDRWSAPSTANNRVAQEFLVAAEVTPLGGSTRIIKGRTRSASGVAMGSQFQISDPAANAYDQFHASVGGDPTTVGPTYYCVTWERVFSAGSDTDIFARIVRTDGTLVGTGVIPVDNSGLTLDENPSISKSCGVTPVGLARDWTIVWQRLAAPGNHDIRGARLDWSGTVVNPSFSIDASGNDDTLPSVSSQVDAGFSSNNYMAVYSRLLCGGCANTAAVIGALMNESTMITSTDLSNLATPLDQEEATGGIQPAIDTDGSTFTVAWVLALLGGPTPDPHVWIANFSASSSGIVWRESNRIDPSLVYPVIPGYGTPKIAACHSAGTASPLFGIAWGDLWDQILGCVYAPPIFGEFCQTTATGTECPCHNQGNGFGCNNSHNTGGARLLASGTPSLQADTLSFTQSWEWNNTSSILLQGTSSNSPVVFGDGVRCVGGTLKRLYTVNANSGGAAYYPPPSAPSVSARSAALGYTIPLGSMTYYQVYYRDANLTFCAGGYNTGTAISVLWIP